MNRTAVLGVGAVAVVMVLAGCVSGIGGGGQQAPAPTGVIIQDEMVPGHEGFPENTTSALVQPCVPLGTYARGMQPAWHVYVIDPATGENLTNETVDTVTVELDNGRMVPTEFHDDDMGWHGCYVLPDDAPTGEMGYTITVEVGGESYQSTGTFGVVERGDL